MPHPPNSDPAPLTGIRVLDLGRHLAGPTAAMWLGDLGADVVKIESPQGDPGRSAGPPFYKGESAFFLSANRNKRSVVLDLKKNSGPALLRRLAANTDVLIENFRPHVMERLGLGYDRLRSRNPRLVYCSITGYGRHGPLSERPGLDQIVQGVAGLMSVTGFEDGEPIRAGVPIADLLAGLFGACGILSALHAREKTGRGQRVDTSLLQSMLAMLTFQGVRYLNGAEVAPPAGNHHPIIAPYGVFRARDGLITIGAVDQKTWIQLCKVIAAPKLVADPRFEDNKSRFENRLQLAEKISERLQARTVKEWDRLLNDAGIPAGPIQDIGEALESEQVKALGMIVEKEHPSAGTVRLLDFPVQLGLTPGRIDQAPPLLGEHTEEVLRETGLTAGEISRLRRTGVIGGKSG